MNEFQMKIFFSFPFFPVFYYYTMTEKCSSVGFIVIVLRTTIENDNFATIYTILLRVIFIA